MLQAVLDRSAAQVTVLSVAPAPRHDALAGWSSPEILQGVRDRLEQVADRSVADLAGAGFDAEAVVLEGEPGKEIVHTATRGEFDLVVVGAGRHTWLERLLLGSTSMYVLHHCPVSVLVVHQAPPADRPVRVLVATDGASWAESAASRFRALADPGRCLLELLSVAPPAAELLPPVADPAIDFMSSPQIEGYLAEHAEQSIRRAREIAESEKARFGAAGFAVSAAYAEAGYPSRAVLEVADRLPSDLVVVGSGHLGAGHALLGSVSDAAARHSRAAFVGRSLHHG